MKFMLAFGLVFELPIVIVFLTKLGILTTEFLTRNRKYAILVNFIVAAILTPTLDLFNQLLMAVPLIALYELGIIGAKIFCKDVKGRRRLRKNPSAALHCILRHCGVPKSTPHSSGFARLAYGLFTKSSVCSLEKAEYVLLQLICTLRIWIAILDHVR